MANVDFSEVLQLADDLVAAGGKIKPKVSKAVGETTKELKRWAVADAPVLTGKLRRSIVIRGRDLNRRVEAQAFYSRFQEYGTSRQPPRPFLTIHTDRARADLVDRISDTLTRVL